MMLTARNAARTDRRFARADQIRDEIRRTLAVEVFDGIRMWRTVGGTPDEPNFEQQWSRGTERLTRLASADFPPLPGMGAGRPTELIRQNSMGERDATARAREAQAQAELEEANVSEELAHTRSQIAAASGDIPTSWSGPVAGRIPPSVPAAPEGTVWPGRDTLELQRKLAAAEAERAKLRRQVETMRRRGGGVRHSNTARQGGVRHSNTRAQYPTAYPPPPPPGPVAAGWNGGYSSDHSAQHNFLYH
jgi:hypothetical protein